MHDAPDQQTILIVDDNPTNIDLLMLILENAGYKLKAVTSGTEALRYVGNEHPHLILLDILMPVMDGFEVCAKLKENPETADIPVIFLSALTGTKNRVRALELGGVDYITKPFEISEVQARVAIHLRLYQQQQEIERLRQRDQEHIAALEREIRQRESTEKELRDLSEGIYKQVEERTRQLDRINNRMAAILGSITDGIVLLNSDGKIENTNNGFDTLLDSYPDAYFGRDLSDVFAPESRLAVETCLQSLLNGEQQAATHALIQRRDQTVLDVDVSINRVKQKHGTDHLVCNLHDITPLKNIERMKSNFVSMVTHELRTPITGVLLLASQITKYYDRLDDEQRRTRIDKLNAQAQALAELVESVLDLSRLEARSTQTPSDTIDIRVIAEEIMAQVQPAAAQKEHTITLEADPVAGFFGDRLDFTLLWRNLVSNAIKYTENGGVIKLRVGAITTDAAGSLSWSGVLVGWDTRDAPVLDADKLYVVGQISDNGHGMSAEDLANLFTRFNRGWAKNSTIPGSGLGLSLVKDVLERYGGVIHVESEIGKGTAFTFCIPVRQNSNGNAEWQGQKL